MIVYLLGKSPFEYRSTETYLDLGEQQSRAGVDVRIIFLHGGTLVARRKNRFEERLQKLINAGAKIYVRKEDLDARAINRHSMSNFASPINTLEIMKLAAESDTLVSVI
nr:DsrH/TusB family sulfur metabolism protein [Candidatus Njordarchaeum guaymaensis]